MPMTEEMQEFGGLQHLYIYLSPQTVVLAYFRAFDPAFDPMFDVFSLPRMIHSRLDVRLDDDG